MTKSHRGMSSDSGTWSTDEIMTVAAARALSGVRTCFVGIGLPSVAANLARLLHNPLLVLIYESGTIGAKPEVLPLSIGDDLLAESADLVVSVPEIFNYWLQGGRCDVGFLGAAQVDRYGNINTTVVPRPGNRPDVRLPGAGGAPEIAAHAGRTLITVRHRAEVFVDPLPFITSVGHGDGAGFRERAGLAGAGPTQVITDLGVLEPDPVTRELTLTSIHPGADRRLVAQATGWDLRVADDLVSTPAPTAEELAVLRDLHARTAAARGES